MEVVHIKNITGDEGEMLAEKLCLQTRLDSVVGAIIPIFKSLYLFIYY